jgi:hypothetical protein
LWALELPALWLSFVHRVESILVIDFKHLENALTNLT